MERSNRLQDPSSIYLDVSQFVLKQHSPQFKPIIADNFQTHLQYFCELWLNSLNCYQWVLPYSPTKLIVQVLYSTPKMTPDVAPIDHDASLLTLSPFFGSSNQKQCDGISQMLLYDEQFVLEGVKQSSNKKKLKKHRRRSNTFYLLQSQSAQLDKIIEEVVQQNCQQEQSHNDSFPQKQQHPSLSYHKIEEKKIVPQYYKDSEFEKQSTNFSYSDPNLYDHYAVYKPEILLQLKQIVESQDNLQNKLTQINQSLSKYLFDYELSFLNQIHRVSYQNSLAQYMAVIEIFFQKKIGVISFESRRVKLLKYLQKKKRRVWKKKVSYDCRKKMADGRLRIKGKFVTRQQICEQLGFQTINRLTPLELKTLLQQRYDDKDQNSLSKVVNAE